MGRTRYLFLILAIALLGGRAYAQQSKPIPSPTPSASPTPRPYDEDDQPVRVFTEEVRLPVVALDSYGHFDPTLVIEDVLVLEDGVPQLIRSVRHIPANVLLVLDTGGGDSIGVGGASKSTSLTREVATDLVRRLPQGSWIEVLQSNSGSQVLQSWTRDKDKILEVLKKKLVGTKRSRFSEAIVTATQQLKDRPEGSRHVVLITDGVDSPGGKVCLLYTSPSPRDS